MKAYLSITMMVFAVVSWFIQWRLIKILRVKFPDKWVGWGRPRFFGTTADSGKLSSKLVFGPNLLRLNDRGIRLQVICLRVCWGVFTGIFAVLIASVLWGAATHMREW